MKAYQTDFKIDDSDEYSEEVNDPNSLIWKGSSVQNSYYGNDPAQPDSNEITQD